MNWVLVVLAFVMSALAAWGGYEKGYQHGKGVGRQQVEPRWSPEPEPKPICDCGHSLAFHDAKGCRHPDPDYTKWPFGKRVAECACLRYIGPEPLPRMIT